MARVIQDGCPQRFSEALSNIYLCYHTNVQRYLFTMHSPCSSRSHTKIRGTARLVALVETRTFSLSIVSSMVGPPVELIERWARLKTLHTDDSDRYALNWNRSKGATTANDSDLNCKSDHLLSTSRSSARRVFPWQNAHIARRMTMMPLHTETSGPAATDLRDRSRSDSTISGDSRLASILDWILWSRVLRHPSHSFIARRIRCTIRSPTNRTARWPR